MTTFRKMSLKWVAPVLPVLFLTVWAWAGICYGKTALRCFMRSAERHTAATQGNRLSSSAAQEAPSTACKLEICKTFKAVDRIPEGLGPSGADPLKQALETKCPTGEGLPTFTPLSKALLFAHRAIPSPPVYICVRAFLC